MLLFIDKIFKGIAKAVEEMERQQAEQAAKQLATLKAARDRRAAVRQSVEQGSVAPIQLTQQHATKLDNESIFPNTTCDAAVI